MLDILVFGLLFLGLFAAVIAAGILVIDLITTTDPDPEDEDERPVKHQCNKCKVKLAQWHYSPYTACDANRYLCDDCIKRGCSCNINPDTGEEDRDEQGRLLPCCEYDFSETGWEVEDEDERN